jgi:amino acid transporter
MARSSKFGTFGGVFTPAILTILGVIMYLRLPWVVGNGGLWMAWGIVVVAHVVSLTTGLSVSSMATDKRVKAGGSYYILSRSLGLPIGGALGIALFVGLSFSVSLYVIGFSESVLGYFGHELSSANIRVVGSIMLGSVATVTLISTALAIKTQYFIMAAIAISLGSILIGSDLPRPETVHFEPIAGGAGFAVLFGIFFPAVTGFEAGVSMSGDLKDPKRSIPVGTMAAIFFGLAVYIALSYFLAWRIPAEELANNPRVLLEYSFMGELVVPGIWGATISSALGSILGAPRILQACAVDGIGPRLFAKGTGAANEPRNALLLTTFIAWGGVLVGELDIIARVVSMFFLTSYGFLNLAAFIESWVSPDFRPDFRIPRIVSLIGSVTCFALMIQMDIAAMVGATVAMAALYAVLKRRELVLEGGDAWSGVFAALVRWSLGRLSRDGGEHERNWRPHIISFGGDGVHALAEQFVGRSGLLSDLSEEAGPGTTDAWTARTQACRYHGLPGLAPNTVLLDLDDMLASPHEAQQFLEQLDSSRYNVLVTRPRATVVPGRIDVWWRGRGGSLAFALALVRSITTARRWRRAGVRFNIPMHNAAERRIVERRISHWLEQARVEADLRSVNPNERPAFESESADAALTLLGLPEAPDPEEWADRLRSLTRDLPNCLLIRPADRFEDPLGESRESVADIAVVEVADEDEVLIADEALAEIVESIEKGLIDAFLEPLREMDRALLSELAEAADECEQAGERALRKFARLQSSDMSLSTDVVARIRSDTWDALADTVGRVGRDEGDHERWIVAAVDATDRALADIVLSTFRTLRVRRTETGEVTVAGTRMESLFRGRTLYLQAELAGIVTGEVEEIVESSIQRLVAARLEHVTTLHTVAVDLGETIGQAAEGGEFDSDWRSSLDAWREELSSIARAESAAARTAARRLVERLVDRMRNAPRRLIPQRAASVATWLDGEDVASTHAPRLDAIDDALEVTELELRMLTVIEALRDGVHHTLQRMHQRLDAGLKTDLKGLRRALVTGATDEALSRRSGEFDASAVTRDLARTIEEILTDVPDTIRIIPELALARMEAEEELDETEAQNIAVRQLVGYLLETEFLRESQAASRELERAARRAEDLLRDAGRIVADLEATSEDGVESDLSAALDEVLERLDQTKRDLDSAEQTFASEVKEQLDDVARRITATKLASTASELSRFVRTREQRELLTSAARAVRKWRADVSQRLVDLALRWDAGWAAARDERRTAEPNTVERLLQLRSHVAPSPAVLDELPVFYRRTFTAQTNDPLLIVSGEDEVDLARTAVARYESGHTGALLVTGGPGAGVTTTARRILEEVFANRPTIEIQPPDVATCDPAEFDAAVASAARAADGTPVETALRSLSRGTVILVHDLELWWMRDEGGLDVIEHLERLIEQFGARFLFVCTASHVSANFFRRLGVLEPSVVGHVPVRPLVAAEVLEAVMRRHRAAGLELRFEGGDAPSDLALARYFSAMRQLTGGAVGPALAAWLAHIVDVDADAITLAPISNPSLDAFATLPGEWVNVVATVAVHRRLDDEALEALLGEDALAAARSLTRAGLFVRREDVTRFDRYMRPYAVRWLIDQGVLQ